MPAIQLGAALAYSEEQLGGPVVENDSNPTIGNAVVDLVPNTGDRVALIVINLGVNDLFMALNGGVSANQGIKVSASGGNVAMNVRDDFTLPARNWKAIAPGGNTSVYVIELIRFALPISENK